MTSTIERFDTVAAGFDRRVAECPPDRWDDPSPCEGWTARDVVVHVVSGLEAVLATADAPVANDRDDPLLDQWRTAWAGMQRALADPATAARTVPGPVGEVAVKPLAAGVLLHDLLVHTWDLARATGQDETLDPATTARALEKDGAVRRPAPRSVDVRAPPRGGRRS